MCLVPKRRTSIPEEVYKYYTLHNISADRRAIEVESPYKYDHLTLEVGTEIVSDREEELKKMTAPERKYLKKEELKQINLGFHSYTKFTEALTNAISECEGYSGTVVVVAFKALRKHYVGFGKFDVDASIVHSRLTPVRVICKVHNSGSRITFIKSPK